MKDETTADPSMTPTLKTLHDALLKRAMSLLPPQTIAPVGSEIVGGHDDTALRIYEMLARNPLPAETTDRDRFTAARLALFACGFNCISVKRDGGRWTLVATEEASVSSQPDASVSPAVDSSAPLTLGTMDSGARLFRGFAAANGFQATMGQDPATAPLWTVAVWISEARLYPEFTEWCSAHSVITEDVTG